MLRRALSICMVMQTKQTQRLQTEKTARCFTASRASTMERLSYCLLAVLLTWTLTAGYPLERNARRPIESYTVGLPGEKGENGEQGMKGMKGERGIVGPQGLNGTSGPQGKIGETGEQGSSGLNGQQGSSGPKGPKGTRGSLGPRGGAGANGQKGDQGILGPEGATGEKGDLGSPGLNGEQGSRGSKGSKGTRGSGGARGNQGLEGQKGEPGLPAQHGLPTGGAIYTRWGRTSCPSGQGTELVYSGRAGGSWHSKTGGAANYLCMPDDPDYNDMNSQSDCETQGNNYVYGVEYEPLPNQPFDDVNGHNAPCAVCSTTSRDTVMMIPAKTQCPTSWTREYSGYLMSQAQNHQSPTMYECVDLEPESVPELNTSNSNSGSALFNHVQASSNGMASPPYDTCKELTCVVCTR